MQMRFTAVKVVSRTTCRITLGVVVIAVVILPCATMRHSAVGATTDSTINGRVEVIGEGRDAISVLYAWGSPYQLGYAHGALLKESVRAFCKNVITAMCIGMGVNFEQLDRAYAMMEPFIPKAYKDEMRGLADGAGIPLKAVQRIHAIPDLSEYHCSFFAAWGYATKDGHLYQIRALDYATEAHIQDHPVILVLAPDGGIPHAVVGWAGFIGAVSGMNGRGIAVSEIGDNFGEEHETLAGEPMPFLLRDVLRRASSLESAASLIANAHRTSSFLYCIGDSKARMARAFVTARDFCRIYSPQTLPFPGRFADIVYMSMGLDSSWNERVYKYLKAHYGRIDEQVSMNLMRDLGTGDLHSVVYDVTDLEMWIANADTDGSPAFKRKFVYFSLRDALSKLTQYRQHRK